MSEWISFKDRLPKSAGIYRIAYRDSEETFEWQIYFCNFDGEKFLLPERSQNTCVGIEREKFWSVVIWGKDE